ncbi:MAG: hypothetical protein JWM80_3773 [Cyanobacteria bacterium RYN_339]|nr:hypothetical protein [Cyanobacteria bacterium RYN_339]
MTQKLPIAITVVSVQTDGEERVETRQERVGTLYVRDGAQYMLYDDEGTATTVRFEPEEIRLYRRGEVSSWQNFQLGELTGGMLSLGPSEMILRIMTSHFRIIQTGATGLIELHYELFTGETADPAADLTALGLGKFTLTFTWRLT